MIAPGSVPAVAAMRRWPVVALMSGVLSLLTAAPPAHADDARAAFEAAEAAERGGRFADALAGYRRIVDQSPTASFAIASRARAERLEAHSEGGFAPLARLEAVRADANKLRDRGELDALARDALAFPDGPTRAEALLVVGEALWHQIGDRDAAATALESAADDRAADPLSRSLALNQLVALRREQGRLDAALVALDRHPEIARELRAEIARLVRRSRLVRASTVVLAAFGGVAAWAFTTLARRRELTVRGLVVPWSLAVAAWIGIGGALFVHLHGGEGDAATFAAFGAGLAVLDVAARAWARAARPAGNGARALRAGTCAFAVVALALVVVEQTDPRYLSGLGL